MVTECPLKQYNVLWRDQSTQSGMWDRVKNKEKIDVIVRVSRGKSLSVEDSFENEDEELDPRMMEEQENLYACTDKIDGLETQLNDDNAHGRKKT